MMMMVYYRNYTSIQIVQCNTYVVFVKGILSPECDKHIFFLFWTTAELVLSAVFSQFGCVSGHFI